MIGTKGGVTRDATDVLILKGSVVKDSKIAILPITTVAKPTQDGPAKTHLELSPS